MTRVTIRFFGPDRSFTGRARLAYVSRLDLPDVGDIACFKFGRQIDGDGNTEVWEQDEEAFLREAQLTDFTHAQGLAPKLDELVSVLHLPWDLSPVHLSVPAPVTAIPPEYRGAAFIHSAWTRPGSSGSLVLLHRGASLYVGGVSWAGELEDDRKNVAIHGGEVAAFMKNAMMLHVAIYSLKRDGQALSAGLLMRPVAQQWYAASLQKLAQLEEKFKVYVLSADARLPEGRP